MGEKEFVLHGVPLAQSAAELLTIPGQIDGLFAGRTTFCATRCVMRYVEIIHYGILGSQPSTWCRDPGRRQSSPAL